MRDASWKVACTRLVAIAAMSTAASAPLAGQAIRTVLLGAETRQPIAGALVILLDSAGRELRRTLTDGSGRVEFAVAAGSYRLQVRRIGSVRWEAGRFRLATEDTLTTPLEAPEAPIVLSAVQVRDERRCRVRPEEGSATATLWDEARKALEATEWTITQRLYRFRTVSYVRQYGPEGDAPTEEQRTAATGFSAWPFASVSLESLSARGFVQRDSTGQAHYYGPDLTVLFSDVFLSQHCFRVREADGDSLIGLGFEPIASRRLNDITGVLWIERRSMELRRLEFSYTRLGSWVGRGARGLIAFERLPSRAWVIRRWFIRAPIPRVELKPTIVDGGYRSSTEKQDTVGIGGYREEGAHVVTVLTASGQTVAVYPEP